MSELKPCPFCGGIPQCGVDFFESHGKEIKLTAVVECTSCGIRKEKVFKATDFISYVPFYDYDNAFKEVVRAWNRRASDDPN